MAKRKKAKKPTETKKAAAKRPVVSKVNYNALPGVAELRLAPNGIRTEPKRNRYITLEFASGFAIRLFPVGVPKNRVQAVSDLVASFLTKR